MIWLDTIVQGILLGGLYALFAAGLSLVFGIMRLVNLAHGDLIVLAAFVILVLVSALGLNPFLAALVAMPLMFAAGCRLSRHPAGQAARPVPARGGLNAMLAPAQKTWRVETRTRASSIFSVVALAAVALGVAAPFFVARGTLQDLFFILTMLVLAQSWNLLAGYAGLVSVGQQAFVGFGAYVMFACVILAGVDPLLSILVAGVGSALLAVPMAFFLFRLQGAYFAIGSWVVAEVVRLAVAQWKVLGGGTGTSLPRDAVRDM